MTLCTTFIYGQVCETNRYPSGREPYLQNFDPTIAVNRYLSRAVVAHNAYKLFEEDGTANCDEPYDTMDGNFSCESSRASFVQSLVTIQASLIWRAADNLNLPYLSPDPNSTSNDNRFIRSMTGMVNTINNQYAENGLSRPVICATVRESNSEDIKRIDGDYGVIIPQHVIEAYRDEMNSQEISYYVTRNDGDVKFRSERIIDDTGETDDAHLKRLEARMYRYWLGTRFIDLGFRGIDMGLIFSFSSESNHYHLVNLVKRLREYASREDGPGMVLLFCEGGDFDPSEVVDGNGNMVFDFSGRAMRPREIVNHPFWRHPYLEFGCAGEPQSASAASFFDFGACSDEKHPAYLDACILNGDDNTPKRSFTGQTFRSGVPYLPYFDYGIGFGLHDRKTTVDWLTRRCKTNYLRGQTPGTISTHRTYSWDDIYWFVLALDNEEGDDIMDDGNCKAAWFDENYRNVRRFNNANGFVPAPISFILKRWDQACEREEPFSNWPPNRQLYLASNYLNLVPGIQETWDVSETSASVSYREEGIPLFNEQCFSEGYKYSKRVRLNIDINVSNPTSTYSIHVRRPSGSWFAYRIGLSASYRIPLSEPDIGEYKIFIREDNLHKCLAPSGTRTYEISAQIPSFVCVEGGSTNGPQESDVESSLVGKSDAINYENNLNEILTENVSDYYKKILSGETIKINSFSQDHNSLKPNLKVYPNPIRQRSTMTLYIETSTAAPIRNIEIVNASGQSMRSKYTITNNQNRVSLRPNEAIAKGVYFIIADGAIGKFIVI